VSGPCTRETCLTPNADRKCSPSSDTARHDTDNSDTDEDEEDKNGEEDTGEYNPCAAGSDRKLSRDGIISFIFEKFATIIALNLADSVFERFLVLRWAIVPVGRIFRSKDIWLAYFAVFGK
jgi:hypothetical protein